MSNTLELRKVIRTKNDEPGSAKVETWEYRTKDVIISILGVDLSSWTAWTPIETVTVTEYV